jgi:hypothetical protein
MLGGVRESMGVQTKSGSAEPGARDFLFGVFSLDWRCTPPNGGLGKSLRSTVSICLRHGGDVEYDLPTLLVAHSRSYRMRRQSNRRSGPGLLAYEFIPPKEYRLVSFSTYV